MKLERRSAFGWPSSAAGYGPCKNGLVVHYDGSDLGLAGKPHSSCRAYWRATRTFHRGPARGWLDIGYSFGVCPHGIVMEGRGWQKQQAAQPGGNSTWTSCTFMSGPAERPTAAQVNAFKELRAWLRGKGLAAAVKGHRDFISTSCPGSTLYSMVRSGALKGAPGQEDDMPSAKEVAEAVWEYPISNQFRKDSKGKPRKIAAQDFLEWSDAHHDQVMARLEAQGAVIDKLVDAVAAGPGVDLDALKAEIREAIEGIEVRLDVAEETS